MKKQWAAIYVALASLSFSAAQKLAVGKQGNLRETPSAKSLVVGKLAVRAWLERLGERKELTDQWGTLEIDITKLKKNFGEAGTFEE